MNPITPVVLRRIFVYLFISGLFAGVGGENCPAQTAAFPGAQGFGQYATGGRGGTVYHVTSLADDGSAGTFRVAVSQPNRIIVFDVGGYITLGSGVSASSSLTIAGQTAPGGGIGLQGAELSFYGQTNIICRHLRVRQGGSDTSESGISLGSASGAATEAGNMIFDHTSVEFGQWDSIDAVNTVNFTIQYCIIADPINQQFGAHVEGSNASYLNNLWVNAHNRQPLAKANTVYMNNVIYDYQAGYTCGDTGGNFLHDIINNYFIAGPSTSNANDDFYQVDSNQSVYQAGNLLDSSLNGALSGTSTSVTGVTNLASPWSAVTATIPTSSALCAYRIDVSSAGTLPSDQLDQLVISQVTSLGTAGRIIGLTTDTGLGNSGYGTIDGGTQLTETDGDGIPDIWKNAVGLPLNTNEAMTIAANGYANIENYLNWLADPHAFVSTNATVIDLWPYTQGFTNASPVYTFFNLTNCTVTLTNSHFAFFKPAPGFTNGLASFGFAVAGNDGTAMTNTMGVLVAVLYTPKNLAWRGDGTNNLWDLANTADWFYAGNTLVAFNNTDTVTFDDTGSTTPAINLTSTVSPGAILFNDTQNYTLSGVGALIGSAALSKNGAGTLTVNTTNSSYTGAISVNGGELIVGQSASIGSGAITLSGGATLATSSGGALVTVPGSITVTAGNSATIGASGQLGNEYSGNLISGDANSTLTLSGGVSFDGASASQFSGFTGAINIPTGATLRFALASSGNSFGSLNPTFLVNGTLQPRNAGNTITLGALNGSGSLTGPQSSGTGSGNTVYNIGGANLNATFSGNIISNANSAGSAICFNKLGAGTQTLTGASTFTGTNGVLAGTLLINGSIMPSLTTVFTNATLGGSGSISGPVTVNAGGILSPGATGIGSIGTLTISNNLTLNSSATLAFDLTSSPGGANDLIYLPGGLLTMVNPPNFNLNLVNNALGAGTYTLITGGTNTSAAGVGFTSNLPGSTRQTFAFQRPASGNGQCYVQLAVGGSAASMIWSGTNGSAWDLSTTTNWLNGSAADKFYNLDLVRFDDTSTNGTVMLATTLDPGSILVTNNALAYTLAGVGALSGSGSFTKGGAGTLTIATTNSSYTGNIFAAGGTLILGGGASIGAGTLTLSGGATFSIEGNLATAFTSPILVPAGQGGTLNSAALGNNFSGNLSSGDATSVLTLTGGDSFGGTSSSQFDGFAGTINIPSGATLRFAPNSSGNTYGSLNPAFVINGTLEPRNAGNTIQLGAFSGSGALGGPQSSAGAGDTVYLIGGNNANDTFSGVISSNSAVAGSSVDVTKIGGGTLTLTGNSTYTGSTMVNAGTLLVNNTVGSGTGSSTVSVNPGATLGGTGTIGGQVSLAAGGTLAPGSSTPGTLNIGNDLGLNNASILQFRLGANSDLVSVTGDLTLAGTLNLSNAGGFGPGTYRLFNYGGALSIGTLTIGTTPASYTYTLNTSIQGQVNLIVSQPQFGGVNMTTNGLVMSGSGGTTNAGFYVLASTNLTKPLSNWTRLLTNQFDGAGNFIFTNAPATNATQSFYLLQMR